MLLHLGVIDQPYAYERQQVSSRTGKPLKRGKRVSLSVSTGDVAEFLEAKYHPMEVFFEIHGSEIAADLEEGLAGALESLLMGAPADASPFASAAGKVEERFRKFLDTKEMETLGYPGVPTEAALRGVNHRMARPYQRRDARASFIDTGLYQTSFKSWVD
jgi:hypothetical protein